MADSPAGELREAAKHMCLGSEGCIVLRTVATIRDRARIAMFGWKGHSEDHADAQYVASMHPQVALAVADWLDRFADPVYCYGPAEFDHALAIARAYLGTGEDR